MSVTRRALLIVSLFLAASTLPAAAQSSARNDLPGAESWGDFNHYVKIALPQRAKEHAEHLLEVVGDDSVALLDIVEKGRYRDYERTLERALKIESLREVTQRLAEKIQHAKIQVIRDKKRIIDDIRRLHEGGRVRQNAMERLKAAGQFAAPLLLRTLQSEKPEDRKLHSNVVVAMVAIGRPMVYPLSVAISRLEPVQMGQVAQVLTDIGYPRAAPFIKEVLESATLDADAREKVQQAYDLLAAQVHLPANVTAAELFLTLGENLYTAATRGSPDNLPGFDPKTKKGIVWSYETQAGLLHTPVPPQVFGDVLAMLATKRALRLNPNMERAVSGWLMANQRRENRLAEGEPDPSYARTMRPPQFYLEMAGPLREHDVLHRALEDGDVDLALDAINALDATAGTDALVNRHGAIQPLLQALSFPDRAVRFAAAFTLTNARPKAPFPGSYRVVPILTEAVGQRGGRTALIIGRDEKTRNEMVANVDQLDGFNAIGGLSFLDQSLADQIAAGPGVDLIVTNLNAAGCLELQRVTAGDYRLAASPILALVPDGVQFELKSQAPQANRLFWNQPGLEGESLLAAIEDAVASTRGEKITGKKADDYAMRAIHLLGEIALSRGEVFNVREAEPALIAALKDPREPIQTEAGVVLALLDTQNAQQALASNALDESRPVFVRVSLLNSLARSAKQYGNHLMPVLVDRVLHVVETSTGDVAIAAARAHGALALPGSHLKRMVVDPR